MTRATIDRFSRRRLLARAAALAAAALAGPYAAPLRASWVASADPFTLGVASGEPQPDGVVLWTRLAPAPTEGGGMPALAVPVEWTVAADEGLRRIVRRGSAVARPELGHAVHVEVDALEPARWYWYRFTAGGAASPVGRTRTAPAAGSMPARLRFAFVSCQHYEQGLYTAYRHLVDEDLDLVLHLGDYIYENPGGPGIVRSHEVAAEPMTLVEYRNRYATYRLDPALAQAHRLLPWVVTWDDHEVDNDYANDQSQDRDDPRLFLLRRAAAYQAYYEHMPLRHGALPRGPDLQLYRRLAFGELATFHVLDNRQYRSDQPCGEGRRGGGNLVEGCAARLAESQTMLGFEQERWLHDGLAASRTRWNLLAQSLMMAELRRPGRGGEDAYWTDSWDGYAAARRRLLDHVAEARLGNLLSIGGDIHSFWANDLRRDFRDERAPALASEFVCTSISSRGIPYQSTVAALPFNPHVHWFESRLRGYVRCELTPAQALASMRGVAQVHRPGAAVRTLASFVVENGRPGVRPA